MTDADAYDEALEHLAAHKASQEEFAPEETQVAHSGEPIPFAEDSTLHYFDPLGVLCYIHEQGRLNWGAAEEQQHPRGEHGHWAKKEGGETPKSIGEQMGIMHKVHGESQPETTQADFDQMWANRERKIAARKAAASGKAPELAGADKETKRLDLEKKAAELGMLGPRVLHPDHQAEFEDLRKEQDKRVLQPAETARIAAFQMAKNFATVDEAKKAVNKAYVPKLVPYFLYSSPLTPTFARKS